MLKEAVPGFFNKTITIVPRLPKKITSPYWLFHAALKRHKIREVEQKSTFALWVKLPMEAKRIYAKQANQVRNLYIEMCARTGKPEDIQRVKAQMLVKVGRLKGRYTYKYHKNPADVTAKTPFQSFLKQTRIGLQDDMIDQRAGYDTYRTIKDLWGILSDEEKVPYEVSMKKDKFAFIENWEVWLRRRFCDSSKYTLPALPERPKTAYKYFFEYKTRQRREAKERGDDFDDKPDNEGRGYFAQVSHCWRSMKESE